MNTTGGAIAVCHISFIHRSIATPQTKKISFLLVIRIFFVTLPQIIEKAII